MKTIFFHNNNSKFQNKYDVQNHKPLLVIKKFLSSTEKDTCNPTSEFMEKADFENETPVKIAVIGSVKVIIYLRLIN